MLSVITLNIAFYYCYAECRYAECRYVECRGAMANGLLVDMFFRQHNYYPRCLYNHFH